MSYFLSPRSCTSLCYIFMSQGRTCRRKEIICCIWILYNMYLSSVCVLLDRYESVGFLLLYLLYCYAMYMNTVLEAWAHTLPVPFPVVHAPVPDENSGLVTYKSAPKSDHGATASAVGGENIIVEGLDPTLSGTGMRDPYGQDAWDDGGNLPPFVFVSRPRTYLSYLSVPRKSLLNMTRNNIWERQS